MPKNKALFGESLQMIFEIATLLHNLDNETCSNKELLADYKKFGAGNFEIILVATGQKYSDLKERLELLEQFKKLWRGGFY